MILEGEDNVIGPLFIITCQTDYYVACGVQAIISLTPWSHSESSVGSKASMLGSSVVNGLSGQPRLIILLLVLVGERIGIIIAIAASRSAWLIVRVSRIVKISN